MKSKNRSKTRSLPFALCLVLLALTDGSCQRHNAAAVPKNILIFQGSIEKLAPDQGILSGGIAVYRLVKYRVEKVCQGNYEKKEIVVDHLILDGKELQDAKIGDRVCVTVKITDKVLSRYNADGIRSPSETVETFYVAADKITRSDQGLRCCDPH